MPEVSQDGFSSRLNAVLWNPSRRVEIFSWVLLVFVTFSIRAYLIHLIPSYLWTRDSGSYTIPVLEWLEKGEWVTDGRRGAPFSLLIALAIKLGGSMRALIHIQHLMGGLAVIACIAIARSFFDRRAMIPLTLCGLALALYSLPLSLEHLVRNETVLFFFATATFGALRLFFLTRNAGWLFACGASVMLLTETKSVYQPFIPLVIGILIWVYLREPKRLLVCLGCLVIGAAIPAMALKVFHNTIARIEPPEPRDGIQLYGRVAQFTRLDGGIAPEIKELIRKPVEDYRKRGDLDNNDVIYRLIVPIIRQRFEEEGKTAADLNALCRQLSLEGIRAYPWAYAKQMTWDFFRLHLNSGRAEREPSTSDINTSRKNLAESKRNHPAMAKAENLRLLEPASHEGVLATYHFFIRLAWLFIRGPILITSILLPWLYFRFKAGDRLFLAVAAVMWYFSVVLLSTVGRPLDRYLMPVVPIMFLTLTLGFVLLWNWARERWGTIESPATTG